MAPRAEPVDETVFDNPHAIGDIGFGPGSFAPTELNAQNVLFYFYQSHFFDRNSTNWSVWGGALQSHHTPEGQRLLNDPRAFEAKLNETADPLRGGGIKYTVVAEPKEAGEPWVIQRSNTVRIEETGKWEVRVEGTWYIVGTRIHMAPSLLDILQSRLLSVSSILQSVFQTSHSLSHWSPSTGHTYLPPSLLSSKPTTSTTAPSSRAGSIAPGSPTHSQNASQPHQTTSQPAPENQTTDFSDDFFLQSLQLTNRYGHEFMDENPLQGEPGAFVFASTNQQVEARNKAQAAAAAQAALNVPVKARDGEADSAVNSVAPTPRPVGHVGVGAGGVGAESRKASVIGLPPAGKADKKRRKSKGPGSPTSPTSATSLTGPGL